MAKLYSTREGAGVTGFSVQAAAQLRLQKRGTATIEAILMLTVFIILWAGVAYMGKLYQARLIAQSKARSCAWHIALTACEEVPKRCMGAELRSTDKPLDSNSLSDTSQDASRGQDAGSGMQDALNSEVDGLFMKRISMSAGASISQPPLLGGGSVQVKGSYSLPCNTKPRTLDDIVDELKDSILDALL